MIYFITDGEYTKIGVAEDPHKRLRQLQTGNARELTLAFSIEGSYELEGKLHKALDNWRVLGEWFYPPTVSNEELILFMSEHTASHVIVKRKKKKTQLEDSIVQEYLRLKSEGEFITISIIAELIGCHISTVRSHLKDFEEEIKKHNKRLWGTDNFNTYQRMLSVHKINDAIKVLDELGEKINQRRVAKKASVHFNTVNKLWLDPNVQDQLERYNRGAARRLTP